MLPLQGAQVQSLDWELRSACMTGKKRIFVVVVVVRSLSCVWLFVTPWTAHARLPCPSPSPRVGTNSCPSSQWCHPTISSSVVPFSSCLQSFPASGSFPVSQFFASGGQSIGASDSVSVLPINIQDWSPLGLTGFYQLFVSHSEFSFYELFCVHFSYPQKWRVMSVLRVRRQ